MPLYSKDAFASSTYDDTVKLVDSIKVEGISGEVDVTDTYASLMSSSCGSTYYDSFKAAVSGGGDWAIVNFNEGSGKRVRVVWSSTANSLTAQFGTDSPSVKYLYLTGTIGYAQFGQQSNGSPVCDYATTPTSLSYVVLSQSSFSSDEGIFANTFNISYPSGYEGEIASGRSTDIDGDGLNAAQELFQGTSDNVKDTDEDGLDDKLESVWNANRDNEFCDTATTPYTCAYPDPLKKDLYVEMDWMNNGTTSYKPTNTQIGLVSDAFAAKDIYFHADTGQFGGGNELPVYISALKFKPDVIDTDFFNLKNGDSTYSPNFTEDRRGIWRYMITGNQYDDGTTVIRSGAAYPGDDDAIVALGQVTSSHPSSVDAAVAGTIMHELGHNLCLSDTAYSGQDSSCLSSLVDSYAGSDYPSSMNYDKQFSLVNYSNGSNILDDHDDWSAILIGMKDFVKYGEDPGEGLSRRGAIFDKQPQY